MSPVIVWFHRDLRLADNPALREATVGGRPVIPFYLLDEDEPRPLGSAARWWLHHSLKALCRGLTALGAPPVLRRGRAIEELPRLAAEVGARTIVWNRRTDPREAEYDRTVTRALVSHGLQVETFCASLLFPPENVCCRTGKSFQMFAPFWRCCLSLPEPPRPLPAPERLLGPGGVHGDRLGDWGLQPASPDESSGLAVAWTPGEATARARLVDFIDERLGEYAEWRDHPDHDATSRLSPHLAFGEISPRQVWHACRAAGAHPDDAFLRELGWREFAHHTLAHWPGYADAPQRSEFDDFPWAGNEEHWQAFVAGRTGYPIVDAGIRALLETGWMHNRVRMIVASFLVKDLLIPWQRGAAWFLDTLVDADIANNACGWQWVTGSGYEAAPYFRIFNPVTQGEKFDSRGRYVRRWVPEVADLPDPFIHHPWDAPSDILRKAGVSLGHTYPAPLVDHAEARRRALQAHEESRRAGQLRSVANL
jgi:deoxyribodipyrimidine photo-lyase